LYEVQAFDTCGFTGPLTVGDCVGVYERDRLSGGSPPSRNAASPPGEWQSLRIWFQEQRVDPQGRSFNSPGFFV
jgi:hypothetical protein